MNEEGEVQVEKMREEVRQQQRKAHRFIVEVAFDGEVSRKDAATVLDRAVKLGVPIKEEGPNFKDFEIFGVH